MGITYTIINETMDLVEKVHVDKRKDELKKQQLEEEKIKKPIIPPKYYQTIDARKANVKTGPYTVEAISESLRNDVIPVGYSLEQLRKVGFGADVREYIRREDDRIKSKNDELIRNLERLKKEMENFVNSDNISQKDKDIIKKYDVFDELSRSKYIAKINKFLNLAKENKLSYEVLNDMTKTLGLKIDDYNDALEAERLKQEHIDLVDQSVSVRDKKVLQSVKRALRNGHRY